MYRLTDVQLKNRKIKSGTVMETAEDPCSPSYHNSDGISPESNDDSRAKGRTIDGDATCAIVHKIFRTKYRLSIYYIRFSKEMSTFSR